MDASVVMAAAAGAAAGALAGAFPGVHPDLAAGILVATAPREPRVAAFMLAAAGAHAAASFLPSLWGAPEEVHAAHQLPAHRLVAAGRAREACAGAAAGSAAGFVAACALALPLGALLAVGDQAWRGAVPYLVLLACALMVWSECTRGRRARALGVVLVAGALGSAALSVPVASPVGLPASVLLPMLSGLFAVPILARLRPGAPAGSARPRPLGLGRWPVGGALMALPAAVLPGFTAGPATALLLAMRRGATPVQAIAAASAVGTAVVVLATTVLHALGRARSGVHAAMSAGAEYPTPGEYPPEALALHLAMVGAGVLSGIAFLLGAARVVQRVPPRIIRALALGSLGGIACLTLATTGAPGLAVLGAAAVVGELPVRLGVRRSQCMACLMLPVAFRLMA